MENIDLVLLTIVIVILFIVFFVSMYKEIKLIANNKYNINSDESRTAKLIDYMGYLIENSEIPEKNKIKLIKSFQGTVADMENDGVYFPTEVKEELKKQREELYCEYSGLPSVKAYQD